MYIKVEFIDCENVNSTTEDAYEAFFKTIRYHFGTWCDESSSPELTRIRIDLKDVCPSSYNVALFFKSDAAIMTNDAFEYYSKIIGCKDGWYIKISENPFDES